MKTTKKNSKKSNSTLIFVLALLIGLFLGALLTMLINSGQKDVRVWSVDETVKIPSDLKNFLLKNGKDDCLGYQGEGSPEGVALFAVQTVEGNYARMKYGCSDDLSSSIVAIKRAEKWMLIEPVEYSNGNENPFCTALEKYNISKNVEPECLDTEGSIQQNSVE
ncbi:MAG TPA: hypothetical protein PKB09_04630 [Candidatus Saccharibacteria bacterium]|nr:hypothetical protein [Candidatus Saccharibacteria bacterium]